MLQHLQALAPAGGARLADLLANVLRLIHRRSVVLFFSDLLEPAASIRQAFRELRFAGHECMIFQVLDRDEIEFPFADSTVFQDLEGPVRTQRESGCHPRAILAAFRCVHGRTRAVVP